MEPGHGSFCLTKVGILLSFRDGDPVAGAGHNPVRLNPEPISPEGRPETPRTASTSLRVEMPIRRTKRLLSRARDLKAHSDGGNVKAIFWRRLEAVRRGKAESGNLQGQWYNDNQWGSLSHC